MGNRMTLGVLLCLTAVSSWGGMFPVMEHALRFMDPFYLTMVRYGIASLLFLSMLYASEGRRALATEGRAASLWVFGSMGFAGFGFLVFFGQQKISGHEGVVNAAVIMATMPLMSAIVTWLTSGKRPTTFTLAAIVLAFIGVFLVVTKGDIRLLKSMDSRFLADLAILAGAFCWVFYTWGGSRFSEWSPLRYTALTCALGTITVAGLTGFGTAAGWLHVPHGSQLHSVAWDLGYMVMVAGIFGVFAWNAGNRLLGSVNGVLFINLVPVVALAISVISGEKASPGELAGALLVIASLVSNNLLGRPEFRFALVRLSGLGRNEGEGAGLDN